MEVHEPDEVVVEVSVVKEEEEEEAPAPKESVLPGSEEGEGRHRVATLWTRILQMDDKKFNYALKVIFVVFPLSHGLIALLFMNYIVNRPNIVVLPDRDVYEDIEPPPWSIADIGDQRDRDVYEGTEPPPLSIADIGDQRDQDVYEGTEPPPWSSADVWDQPDQDVYEGTEPPPLSIADIGDQRDQDVYEGTEPPPWSIADIWDQPDQDVYEGTEPPPLSIADIGDQRDQDVYEDIEPPRGGCIDIGDQRDRDVYEGFPMETLHPISWLFVAMALCFALLALILDVEKPVLKCRPVPKWMVRLAEGTCSTLKECYHLTTTELLPHHRAAHEEASQEHSGLA